jgi:hypothetical protein
MAHLATCTTCHALCDEQTQLTESLHTYGTLTERELPAGVVARIWDAVETPNAPTFIEALAAWFRPVVALPIAAVLALALYVGIAHPRFTGAGVAVIDAAYYIDDHAALTGTVPFSEGNVVPPSLENDETGADQHWVASTGASDVAETR